MRRTPAYMIELFHALFYELVTDCFSFDAVRELRARLETLAFDLGLGRLEARALATDFVDRAMEELATDPRCHHALPPPQGLGEECPI